MDSETETNSLCWVRSGCRSDGRQVPDVFSAACVHIYSNIVSASHNSTPCFVSFPSLIDCAVFYVPANTV